MKKAIDFIIWTIIIIILSSLVTSKRSTIVSILSGVYRSEPDYDRSVEPLKLPEIEYPTSAIRRGAYGDVMLRFRVRTDGSVHSVTVDGSSGHADIDSAAMEGIKSATFKPATKNGNPVESVQTMPILFHRR